MTESTKVTEFVPDQNNANRGTERGNHMLRQSIQNLGLGRSAVADKHGNLIAGNKTAEAAVELGLENAIVVKTTGDQLVIVQRTDLDLNEVNGVARQLAYADNRVGQVSLDFDPDVISIDAANGTDFSNWFHKNELDLLTGAGNDEAPDWAEFDSGIEIGEEDNSGGGGREKAKCPKCGYEG